jgi:predicted PurR-regulated permease PerM
MGAMEGANGKWLDGSGARAPASVVARAGGALANWWRAVTLNAMLVGALWWLGLALLHVPLAPLWALLAAILHLIPHFGGMLALIGPTLSLLFAGRNWEEFALLLGLYAAIIFIDQLALQPWLMKRTARVPVWASILGPIVLGIVIPFWGVLLAPPLLAVAFAFRKPKTAPTANR